MTFDELTEYLFNIGFDNGELTIENINSFLNNMDMYLEIDLGRYYVHHFDDKL